MIPDTSAQDRTVAAPKRRLPWVGIGATAGLVAVLVAVWAWAGAGRSVSAERLRFATVERGLLVRDAQVSGRIVAAVSPTLYAPAASTVNLRTRAGATVKQGDVLATLDSPELRAERDRELATLRGFEADVARQRILAQKARLLAARTADEGRLALQTAQRDAERTARACELQAIPRADCLRYADAVEAAQVRARHSEADAGLEGQNAALELKSREEALARQRAVVADLERRVSDLDLRSPVNGIVGSIAVADRAVVPANAPLMTVVDLSQLEVELEVPETYADDLGLGMRVEVRIGAQTVGGELMTIAPEVLNRQVLARVRLDAPPEGLRQSQRVSARVLIEEKPDVLKLARGPFLETQGGRFAYVMDGGDAVRRPISVGATAVGAIEIVEGLREGERVVIAGTDLFENAERVQVNE
ncbi:efflux RND transporter periplasmic adaptor subunit [Silanimonas sp.]|uniref:efflux RND transporter periplasmic adaptor subunit n=1 Tax=Silanimonas sp. TaxID=1929290 RepID=UPI0022BC7FAE|nr:efflux RND transporter periplasmic adaptor subunit [Silanimonas sp.]MCZ8116388.1 efflux RND transporter periplasmic adaptor subunit [Silanimonas sp.]